MDSPVLTTLDKYKFRTTFHPDSVEHTTHTSNLRSRQRRVEVKTKWTREKELGSGAFGVVWKEREEKSKELRAVKIILRRLINVREVEALAELQNVGRSPVTGHLFRSLTSLASGSFRAVLGLV